MIDYRQGVTLGTIDHFNLNLLREWRNDPKIFKWTRQHDLLDEASHYSWAERLPNDPTLKMYLIYDRNKNEIGVCGLTSLDLINRTAEFSLYIASKYQKRGYGEAALKTLLSHGFLTYGLYQIWGETFENNPAQHLFKKLGFHVNEGPGKCYFKEGKHIKSYFLSMLIDEWKHLSIFNDCRVLCST